jgi:hypothetical protein
MRQLTRLGIHSLAQPDRTHTAGGQPRNELAQERAQARHGHAENRQRGSLRQPMTRLSQIIAEHKG